MRPENADRHDFAWGARRPAPSARALLEVLRPVMGHGRGKRLLARLWIRRYGEAAVDVCRLGLRLRLRPKGNAIEAKLLFGGRRREAAELRWIAGHPARTVFVDVGANIGYYTLAACRMGFERVISIEPNPDLLERLRFHAASNGFIDRLCVCGCAVSDRRGRALLEVPLDGDMGGARLVHFPSGSDAACSRHEVPVLPLAELLDREGVRRVDVMKMDVEGHEDRVLAPYLETAPRTAWPGAVILEHLCAERWAVDLYAILERAGYRRRAVTRSNTLFVRECRA